MFVPVASERGFALADEYTFGILFLAVAVFAAIAALSHQEDRPFSASVIYLGLGTAAAFVIDAAGIDWLDPLGEPEVLERITELAVAIAVFSTGLRLQRARERRWWGNVTVLLAVVMPATIAAVTLFGTAVMGLSFGAALILGSILAPTGSGR